MLFTSYAFIGFVLVLLVLYYAVPRRFQKLILFVGNVCFYVMSGWTNLIFMGITILSTYGAARWIGNNIDAQKAYVKERKEELSREEKKAYKAKEKKKRKLIAALAVILNVALLALVKFPNRIFLFLMPMGISFYTLMSLGYLLDVYWEKQKPEKSLFRFALFVSFFPQLVQGPISRFKDLSESLYAEHALDWKNIYYGFVRVLWGFFKKLVIADRLSVVIATISGDFDTYNGAYIFLEMFLYTIQLYADFSGGIDITIGVAQMLGVEMAENFIRPYFSKSLKEYWRRWHITMSTWFRDYLFYPISITKTMQNFSKFLRAHFGDYIGKRLPVYVASFIVWFVTGIWHGTTSNFIVWGLVNYVILMISEELEPAYAAFHEKCIPAETKGWRVFMVLRTFTMLCFLKLFDCYQSAGEVFRAYGSAFTFAKLDELVHGGWLQLGMSLADYVVVAVGSVVILTVSLIQRRESVRDQLSRKPFALQAGVVMALFLVTLIFGAYGMGYDASQFIYNRF